MKTRLLGLLTACAILLGAAPAALERGLRLAQGTVPDGTQALAAARPSDDAVRAALDLQVRSVGFAQEKPEEQALAGLLGWPESNAGEEIVLDTPDVDRAMYHLRSLGVEFDETMERDEAGRLCAVRLRQPVRGLRCEIVRR